MGENLVLNMESKGFHGRRLQPHDRGDREVRRRSRAREKTFSRRRTMEEFVGALQRPRKAMIMVKAGAPVDAVISQLVPLLEKGDVIIDGGNSLFTDTQRRCKELEGTRNSFCRLRRFRRRRRRAQRSVAHARRAARIVGNYRADLPQDRGAGRWRALLPLHGPDGAGHYVKMVHNGIEYGDMQLICEAYAILRRRRSVSTPTSWPTFSRMEQGRSRQLSDRHHLRRFFARSIPKPASRWSTSSSTRPARKGPASGPCNRPSSNRSSSRRSMPRSKRASFLRAKRSGSKPSKILPQPKVEKFTGDRDELITAVRDALYASKIVSYAQGMELLGAASKEFNWNLNFGDIATIWRGGCIIRAKFLNRISRSLRARSGAAQSAPRLTTSPRSFKRRSTTGGSRSRPRSSKAWPCRRSARRWLISTVTGRRVCPRICSRRSAISLARTPTSESTSRASFTPSGWNPDKHRPKNRPQPKAAARRTRRVSSVMPIYVYETPIPSKPMRRFEVKQSMRDEPLRVDPETGESVRRVISGGYGVHVPGGSTGPSVGSVGGILRPGLRLSLAGVLSTVGRGRSSRSGAPRSRTDAQVASVRSGAAWIHASPLVLRSGWRSS